MHNWNPLAQINYDERDMKKKKCMQMVWLLRSTTFAFHLVQNTEGTRNFSGEEHHQEDTSANI